MSQDMTDILAKSREANKDNTRTITGPSGIEYVFRKKPLPQLLMVLSKYPQFNETMEAARTGQMENMTHWFSMLSEVVINSCVYPKLAENEDGVIFDGTNEIVPVDDYNLLITEGIKVLFPRGITPEQSEKFRTIGVGDVGGGISDSNAIPTNGDNETST